jgi:hypothetical protein
MKTQTKVITFIIFLGNNNSTGGGQSSGKRHPLDDFMKKFLSKTNLSAPPLDNSTALKILNIEITK